MTPEEVLALIESILQTEKQSKSKLTDIFEFKAEKKTDYKKLPNYNDIYVDAVKQRDRINIHADPDVFPYLIFARRSPNQTDEQFEYVKENYQCTTNPVWIDYQSVIGRSFIDTNWNITWPEENEDVEDFREYTTSEVPIYGSVENFVTQVMPSIKGVDANGVIAVRPYRFALIVDDEGNARIDDQEPFEPTIFYHQSKDVLLSEDNFTLCVDDEKSVVKVGSKDVKEGRVLYLYTTESIFKIIQVGKKTDNKYAIAWEYQHEEGVVPATKLKGVPVINSKGKIYWVSRFYYAVPLLDLALSNRNILQVSINSSVFPFRVMMATECEFSENGASCYNGTMQNEDGTTGGTCPKCNGSGQSIPVSPLGVYYYQQPDAINGGSIPSKPVDYISPQTDSLEFVREQVELDTDKAKNILHLQTSNSEVKGSENMTATGMAIDQKSQWAFIRAESDQMFDAWDWILKRMAWQRYSGVISEPYSVVPTIHRPQTFDFRTEQDIWNEIKTAREADAPPFVIHQLYYQLLTNIYSNDPKTHKIFETVVTADKLFSLSEQDIALRKASNTIDNYELTLHHSALQLIGQILIDDSAYLDKELEERIKILVDLSKSSTFTSTNNALDNLLNQTT